MAQRHPRRAVRSSARPAVRALVALALVLAVLGIAGAGSPGHPSVATAETTATAGDATSTTQPATPTAPAASGLPLATAVCPPSRGAYIGIFRPGAQVKPAVLATYKTLSGKPAAMVMWFQPWTAKGANKFDAARAVSVWKSGAVPIIVWEPWSPGDKPHNLKKPADMPDWQLSKIVSGTYDAYITSFAQDVKASGGPVMISLFHEMNGCWYPWCGTVNGNTPATFVSAWRHVHDIFEREGATNVTWLWSINFESRPPTRVNRFAAYYPGDAYVDWVGASGFNWGKGCGGGPWKSFDNIYKTPLRYLKTTHKPVMITEMGSVEKGGNKARWLTDAFKRIRTRHPEVKAVIYYDAKERSHAHVQDWRINSSRKSLKAYRSAVAARGYVGGRAGALAEWRDRITLEQWSALLRVKRIYKK